MKEFWNVTVLGNLGSDIYKENAKCCYPKWFDMMICILAHQYKSHVVHVIQTKFIIFRLKVILLQIIFWKHYKIIYHLIITPFNFVINFEFLELSIYFVLIKWRTTKGLFTLRAYNEDIKWIKDKKIEGWQGFMKRLW